MDKALFISYSTSDSQFVKRLAHDCEKRNIEVFYFQRDLRPGDNIWSRISKEIQEKRVVGVVLSSESASAKGVLKEIEMAYQHFGLSENIFLVPILKDPLLQDKIPEKLRGLFWADFSQSYVSGLIQLFKSFEVDFSLYNEIAIQNISESRNLYELSFRIIKTIYEIVREPYIQFIVQGREKQEIQYVVVADCIPENCFRYRLVSLTGVIGQAISDGDILEIHNVEKWEGYIKAESTTKSELVLPIHGNRYGVIGAINIESKEIDGFSSIDKQELLEVSNIAGDVLETRNWIPSSVGDLPSFWFSGIERLQEKLSTHSRERIAEDIEKMQRIQDGWNFVVDGDLLKIEDVKFFHVSERIRHAKDLAALGFVDRAIKLLESAPPMWKDDRIPYELQELRRIMYK